MNHTRQPFSRRRLLAGAAAASAVSVTGVAATSTAAAASPTHAPTPLVTRDRVGSALLHAPGGGPVAARFQADFHDRLVAWLAFWSANSPAAWSVPVQVVGRVDRSGDAFTLHALRYRRDDELHDGFAAGRADANHWATLASLHHHFPVVAPLASGAIQVGDGVAGFTGSPAQVAFAVDACRELWGDQAATASAWPEYAGRALTRAGQRADVASRAGWAAFTRTSLRRGLGTESYE
ncbi:hypothetical protein GA0074695_5829 [Micromonospora viridifaciens]|uniref:Tat (Twin-arginine translocation) pathway signal sequence n=1 Tax=Micromonospora viridifaciens TaxID=1881 RepID=A0A1C4ZN65_MICVI|nr:hypothetical protein [Micromonospora viridifaciens]SCF34246.1 hypothetical protein GA0074695_5829 [Micromonospora viridifaciens]